MRGRGLSLQQLLSETRYRELRPHIIPATVVAHVTAHPELVEQWLMYSEDKRTSGGWYFTGEGREWELGRLDSRSRRVDQRRHTSSVEACASYILRELDFWADLAEGKP